MKRIRVIKDRNFTTINNEFIFKKDMSLKAKGLLIHLLALPDNWKLYVEEVITWHKDGRAAIYSAFKELVSHGYVKRNKIRDKGKIVSHEYIVYEKPHVDFQHVENEDVKNQYVENRTLLNTNSNKDLKKIKTKTIKKKSFTEEVKELSLKLEFNEVEEFLDYWTEKSKGAKKCRWQKQTSFDIKRRIQRWMKNNTTNTNTANGFPNHYNPKFERSLDPNRAQDYAKHLRELGWVSKYSPAGGVQWKAPK